MDAGHNLHQQPQELKWNLPRPIPTLASNSICKCSSGLEDGESQRTPKQIPVSLLRNDSAELGSTPRLLSESQELASVIIANAMNDMNNYLAKTYSEVSSEKRCRVVRFNGEQ